MASFQETYYYTLTTGIETITDGPFADYDFAVAAAQKTAETINYPVNRTWFKIEKRYVKVEG